MKSLLTAMLVVVSAVSAEIVWTPNSNSVSDWFNWQSVGTAAYQNTEQQMKILLSIKSGKNQSAGVGFNWQEEGATKSLSGTGVCLTYRASAPFRLDMNQSSITDSDFWGTKVPAAANYTSLFIPFSDLAQEGWGKKVSWSLANHKGMQFSYKGSLATKTDSSTTIDILQIGLGNVCDSSNIPATGTEISIAELFWNSTSIVPSTPVNSLGASFNTYTTGSSSVEKSVQAFLDSTGAVGFSAELKGSDYPTAGITMNFTASDSMANISKSTGICIAYRSTSGMRMQLLQEGIAWNNSNYFGYDLPKQESYTVLEIPFENLSQEAYWGYKAVLDLERAYGLQFELKGTAGKKGDIEILQLGMAGTCELPKFAPTLNSPYNATESTTLYEGDTLRYALKTMFTDRDDSSLDVIYSVEPTSGIINLSKKNDTLYVVPVNNISGSATLAIIATDKDAQMAMYSNTITVIDKQNSPSGKNDTYEVLEDSNLTITKEKGILANDFDLDGDAFEIASYTNPGHGTLELNNDGSFVYIPEADFAGVDNFTYTLKDSSTTSNPITVTILVKQVNDKPTVTGSIANVDSLLEDFSLKIVYVNKSEVIFSDKETETTSLEYGVSTDGNIKATLSQNETQFIIALLPEKDKFGTAVVTLYAKDSGNDSVGISFNVEILPVSDPPIATDDSYIALEDSTLSVAAKEGVLKNDLNPDGESTLFAILQDSTKKGIVLLNTDGSFEYSPTLGFVGTDSFTYIVVNALNDSSALATVSIEVQDRNNGPSAVVADIDTTLKEDFTTTLKFTKSEILKWFNDAENDPIYYSIENEDGKVNASLTSGGYLNIKSVKDSVGEAIVKVIATDSIEGTKPAVVNIRIELTPVNDLPKVVLKDTIVVEPLGFNETVDLNTVFFDADGDELTYSITSANNSLVLDLQENILNIAPKNDTVALANGVYRIKVSASDAEGSVTATIVIDVGGTSGLAKTMVKVQQSWRNSLPYTKGTVKLLDLNGRVLLTKKAPVLESEISEILKSSNSPMILKTNLGLWKLAPKF